MTGDRTQRIATAVGFLSGVYACLHVLRDASVFWPPNAVWDVLYQPQRLELGCGVALIVVTIAISIAGIRPDGY